MVSSLGLVMKGRDVWTRAVVVVLKSWKFVAVEFEMADCDPTELYAGVAGVSTSTVPRALEPEGYATVVVNMPDREPVGIYPVVIVVKLSGVCTRTVPGALGPEG